MGCVIVTYNSANHILNCLQSLAHADPVAIHLVIVDNASSDGTGNVVQDWIPPPNIELTLIQSRQNLGFAGGVNLGLKHLLENSLLDRFWMLNPDCTVSAQTPKALLQEQQPFSLLGCRLVYGLQRAKIQIDGGQINTWTGSTKNINLGRDVATTALPSASSFDFISGASMVASRQFLQQAGLMPEQYFLYYEEVDWAQNRTTLPLAISQGATVYHSAGASIGSPTLSRGPSPVSAYFKHRSRMKFMASHYPLRVPIAYLFGWIKILQHAVRRQYTPIPATLRALHGMPPSKDITAAINSRD